MDDLEFSQKFPFTEVAKKYLRETKLSLEDVSEEQVKKAALIILRANSRKEYYLEIGSPTKEILEKEIIAFPIAKLLVSTINIPNIIEKFSDLYRRKTFNEIQKEKKVTELTLDLAKDFGIDFEFCEDCFKIPLLQYLDIYFVDEETKLVNKRVEKGKVFLNNNDFVRFLSEKAFKKIFDSLPIEKQKIPKNFLTISKKITPQLTNIQQKDYSKLFEKIRVDLFPPTMLDLYNKQLAGQKLSYYERLTIGGFLQQIGMQKNAMLEFFSKSPDYKKNIAEYHVNRIFEVGLSAPNYKKMSDFGIIISEEEKNYVHPIKYYSRMLKLNNKKRVKNV